MASPEEITRHHDPDPSEDPWVNGPPPDQPVDIGPYDDRWPGRFDALAANVRTALGGVALAVEHVGSTSVPRLAAKNVIDIDLTVPDPSDESSYVPALEAAGWVLTIREPSWHNHRCLTRREGARSNLHV
ncbi:MAG: GrpB family protein, partial [Actinomycetota bacterium]|nr:GrpB family protein [Actinomycetota bacterium]